jgi:hypothetical protein
MAIKTGKPGTKTLRFEAGTWYEERSGHIHLTIPGHSRFHTTVSNDPASRRYHPNLFRKLKDLLIENGLWPSEG